MLYTDRILLKIFLRQKLRERVRGSGHVISRRSILHLKFFQKYTVGIIYRISTLFEASN